MVLAPIARVALLDGFLVQVDDQFGNLIDAEDLPHGVQRLVAHLSLCSRPARSAASSRYRDSARMSRKLSEYTSAETATGSSKRPRSKAPFRRSSRLRTARYRITIDP